MKINNITISNVGVFKGEHKFELRPIANSQTSAGSLTIINGHNGAGKSTLFRAIALALHGSQSPLSLSNGLAYETALHGLVHRSLVTELAELVPEASIRLQLEYVRSGNRVEITLERKWKPQSTGEQETLSVLCNGSQPDVEPDQYQTWINDHISPDVIPLCFFDAEQLDTLSSPDRYNKMLGALIRRLFSLDLVDRLYGDLRIITLRQGRESDQNKWIDTVSLYQTEIDKIKSQIADCQTRLQALDQKQVDFEANIRHQTIRLAAEGGEYEKQRPLFEKRLSNVQRELEKVAMELRDLSAFLLPFAIAPELCRMLSRRLYVEAEARQKLTVESTWKDRVQLVKQNLDGSDFWKELTLNDAQRKEVRKRLVRLLSQPSSPEMNSKLTSIHQLSEPVQAEIQVWLKQATETLPQHVAILSQRCHELRQERQELEIQIRRAPDEVILKPIHEEIVRVQTELKKVQHENAALNQEIGSLQFRLTEQVRLHVKAEEEVKQLNARHRQHQLAEKSKQALYAYQDALTSQRTQQLEKELVTAFNSLCSKERLISDAHIDSKNFKVELRDINQRIVRLDDLSAGERHLYVLALLWALRKVSKLELPLFIDTPLARLDERHRLNIVHNYLPRVSNQVILFTTDAEMNSNLVNEAKPYLSRIYKLRFDEQSGETSVTKCL